MRQFTVSGAGRSHPQVLGALSTNEPLLWTSFQVFPRGQLRFLKCPFWVTFKKRPPSYFWGSRAIFGAKSAESCISTGVVFSRDVGKLLGAFREFAGFCSKNRPRAQKIGWLALKKSNPAYPLSGHLRNVQPFIGIIPFCRLVGSSHSGS